jgi:hypothetical protein
VKETTGDIQTLTLHVVSDTESFDRYYYYSAVRKGQVLEWNLRRIWQPINMAAV